MQKDRITAAALEILATKGLTSWTVAEVATRAECAKGLVHYHHKTKEDLLAAVAERLASARVAQRLAALDTQGARALDRLWGVLEESARSGEAAAYQSLMAHSSPAVRNATRLPESTQADFSEAVARALAIDAPDGPTARYLWAVLDGLESALIVAADGSELQEAFHRVWLTIL